MCGSLCFPLPTPPRSGRKPSVIWGFPHYPRFSPATCGFAPLSLICQIDLRRRANAKYTSPHGVIATPSKHSNFHANFNLNFKFIRVDFVLEKACKACMISHRSCAQSVEPAEPPTEAQQSLQSVLQNLCRACAGPCTETILQQFFP